MSTAADTDGPGPDVFDRVRASCARVAAGARHVRIDPGRLETFADELHRDLIDAVVDADPGRDRVGDDEATVAFVVTLDAVNFGSGWFPVLAKRPGLSGYHTIATCLREHVHRHGPPTGAWLRSLDTGAVAAVFGQDPDGPAGELMGLFARALVDLGTFVDEIGGGSFLGVVEAAGRSGARLVGLLDTMAAYHDVYTWHDPDTGEAVEVAFYKRAQITVHDLHLAFGGGGPGRFDDLERLTIFADNLVPHVLRVEGVLVFDDELVDRIEAVDDITSGSAAEVEIRACGVHACELLVGALARRGRTITAAGLDTVVWNLGGRGRYKAVARHRTRSVHY